MEWLGLECMELELVLTQVGIEIILMIMIMLTLGQVFSAQFSYHGPDTDIRLAYSPN